jgi:hypothetical protein
MAGSEVAVTGPLERPIQPLLRLTELLISFRTKAILIGQGVPQSLQPSCVFEIVHRKALLID